jgi:hypothetical protein
MTHYAVIQRLELHQIEGANTLQLAIVEGLPYAVSKEYNENDLYVVFRPDGRLSEEYSAANDLIQRTDPVTGKNAGGYFSKNRKVRCISLMKGKLKSVGYVAPLSSLEFTGADLSSLELGFEFSELNGVPICCKFVTEATRRAQSNINRPARAKAIKYVGFDMHQDTAQLRHSINSIPEDSQITITLKLDGTSVRIGNAYAVKKYGKFLSFIDRFLPLRKFENRIVVGTRRTVLEDKSKTFYGDPGIYVRTTNFLRDRLLPGETVYGEVVGWSGPETPLFKRGGMVFKYGTAPGTTELYVYAIKWTLVDGTSIHLPWNMVKERCLLLGAKHVPELIPTHPFLGVDTLQEMVDEYTTGPDLIDPSHVREGVVVRVDVGTTTYFRKNKSVDFLGLEDASKNDESFVDIEEVQDV